MSIWLLVLLVALLGSAFFSGSETAMISSNRMRQRAAREEGRPLAAMAERLYRVPERMLAVLLLGTNVFNVLASVTAVLLTERLLVARGWHLPSLGIDMLATLWIAALVLVFGEVLPKGLGRVYADRITRAVSVLLVPLSWILWPLLFLLEGLSRLLGRLFSQGPTRGEIPLSWETVRLHVETGREEGMVAQEEEVLIGRIALLNRLSARSLMRPLSQLPLFPMEGNVGELLEYKPEGLPSRIFLFEKGSSNLTGCVASLKLLGQPADQVLSELASGLRNVPASRPLLDLIDELQFTHSKFALVTDLDGSALGVVFLRDLLEKLVRFKKSDDIHDK
jgi:putative hemolysin